MYTSYTFYLNNPRHIFIPFLKKTSGRLKSVILLIIILIGDRGYKYKLATQRWKYFDSIRICKIVKEKILILEEVKK